MYLLGKSLQTDFTYKSFIFSVYYSSFHIHTLKYWTLALVVMLCPLLVVHKLRLTHWWK